MISDGEVSSVVCVKFGYWFVPNVHLVQADYVKGIRREGYWSVGGRSGIGFGGADDLPSLGKITLGSFIFQREVLGGVIIG